MAEERACTEVTAIGMIKASEQKKTKLNNRDAEKFWPGRPRGQDELRAVPGRGRDVPECAGTQPVGVTSAGVVWRFPRQPIVLSDLEAYEAAHGVHLRQELTGGVRGARTFFFFYKFQR